MSPCSYVNADVTSDLASLLKIKRKTNSSGRRGGRGAADVPDTYGDTGIMKTIRPGRLGSTRSSKYAKLAEEKAANEQANGFDGLDSTCNLNDASDPGKKRNILTYNPPPAAFAVAYSKRQKTDDPTLGGAGQGGGGASVPGLVR